jgi:RNA polymerase sigma factor (sigma-70 family)
LSAVTTLSPRRRSVAYRFLADDRLGRLAAEGDAAAFAVIFERHHQAVYRYSRSIVRDPDDASDVLQNTMVKALRALPEHDGDVNVRAWLFRVAHNEAVSVLRRRRPQAELTEGDGGASPGPEEHATTRERLDELLGDLAQLPERQRGALVMRELSGLSYSEVAEALESTEAAAKQAVYEARTALVDSAQGRDALCEDVRRSLSNGDRRVLRGRKVRAHLRACEDCRAFQATVETRRRELGALVPALSPGAAAGVLDKALASAGLGSGGTGGGLAGLMGSGELLGGSALKAVAVAAIAASGAGAGAVGVSRALGERDEGRPSPPARVEAVPPIAGTDTTPRSLVAERLDPEADGFGDRDPARSERERTTEVAVADAPSEEAASEEAAVTKEKGEETADTPVAIPDSVSAATDEIDIAGYVGGDSGSGVSTPAAAEPVLTDSAPVRTRVRDTVDDFQQDAREIRDRMDALPVPEAPATPVPEVPVPETPAIPEVPVAEVPIPAPAG